ncbi:hypothetical protein TWF788_000711 [Orbilia oligospora]|uniref:Uncharacterized protein n=1 Tax=Orbilia oligospora TaxID=2813651 RepID=A0A7C8K981_ORBOL|nr:hypothetical protein TWF788_000711 [Orbilia oligospora]
MAPAHENTLRVSLPLSQGKAYRLREIFAKESRNSIPTPTKSPTPPSSTHANIQGCIPRYRLVGSDLDEVDFEIYVFYRRSNFLKILITIEGEQEGENLGEHDIGLEENKVEVTAEYEMIGLEMTA